jgi:hypothetical protein
VQHAWERREMNTKILVGNLERKRPQGGTRYKQNNNITIHLKEIWCEGMDWINLAQEFYECGIL